MKNHFITLCFIIFNPLTFADVADRNGINARENRKLFGGYRITPKFCKSTRTTVTPPGGANICMFNYECSQRGGQVVGACMDGFLFGTCCQLPESAMIGDFLSQDYPGVSLIDNKLSSKIVPTTHRTTPMYDITSHGVSQIAASLLHGNPPFSGDGNVVPTANDNTIQIQAGLDNNWSTGGVTHTVADTVVNDEDNEISSSYFSSTKLPNYTSKKTTPYGNHEETTMRYAENYPPPILQISVSNAPVGYTPLPTIQRPMFRPKPPKPTDENYILIPTLTHESNKPNKTEDDEAVAIESVNLINHSTSSRPLTTFSYVSSSTPSDRKSTSKKPPSTSYVYSTTIPPRRTESTTNRKPIKSTISSSITSSKPPSTSYVYSSTFRPTSSKPNNVYSSTSRPNTVAHSTFASTPEGFPGSSTPSFVSSSSYGPSTTSSHIAGPGFTVTSQPIGHYSSYPTPAPTVIVLGPISEDSDKDDGYILASSSSRPTLPTRIGTPSTTTTSQPPSQFPQRKPVNHVTINNHVTQNIYSTQRPQTSSSTNQNPPLPTVIITPKPTISSTSIPLAVEDADLESVVITSTNDLNDFPPDRNPNLNLSVPVLNDDDITTPSFIEDDAMNETVESFVNQIIYGLQEPFNNLKDIVYNKANATGTKFTTKKPGTTTKKPITKPNAVKVTTRRPVTTKRPGSASTIRIPTTTTTRRPSVTLTTIQNYIETETESEIQQSYRDQCGLRPLLRNGRIVGGRGAQIGEFPWQVLVRESTWLGLLTKNKCGGVLISEKYVITAAHCQPGFLASLVAVFGEYDISGDLETRKPVSRNVKRVIVHRKYDAATFENDLALLELESAVKFDAHIIPVCLPPDNIDYAKRMATVTGWGRLKYGGGVPSVLQEVQVPIMENTVCQDMFRTAGHSKVILDSFLCAGYANGQKDACEGDSGGPLVVQRPDGRYELAGTVSHGIKCAAPYLPGVYMRTTYYKPWITSITGLE